MCERERERGRQDRGGEGMEGESREPIIKAAIREMPTKDSV